VRGESRRRLFTLLLAGGVLAALLGLMSLPPGSACGPSVAALKEGTVTRVYDGDTIEVAGTVKVRLLGIDAMDAYYEDKTAGQARRYGMTEARVRHWADRAGAFVREQAEGATVALHHGPELFDDYGRLLAYVHLPADAAGEGPDLSLALIRQGLAAAYHRSYHPRRESYLEAERDAWQRRAGFWGEAARGP